MTRRNSWLLLRRTTALTTVLAFALTFSLADWVAAQTTPTPKRARRASPAAAEQGPAFPTPTPLPTAMPQTRLQIEHDPLSCVTTVSAPVVEAKVQPGPEVSKSYVYWRASGTPYFYYTIMEGPVPAVKGMIPRPLPETRAVDYFVQATDTASLSRKTPEYAPPVVQSKACKDRGPAVGKGGAGLTIGLTDERQSPIPPGFNKADIAKVILLTGAVVGVAAAVAAASSGAAAGTGAGAAGAAAGSGAGAGAGAGAAGAAAAGGGISSTVLIVGGVAVAAGVGAAVASGSKSAATPTPPPPTPTHTFTPTPTPVPNHFIEVDATWSGVGNVDVKLITGGLEVGQTVAVGCDPTSSRTERVFLTESAIATGDYQVRLTGVSCGAGTPGQIATVVSVVTDTAPKCQTAFVNVPVGGTVDGCSFHVP